MEHGYEALQVLADVDLTVERGERIALVTPTAPASRPMRLLPAWNRPVRSREEGHKVLQAYFAQDQARILDAETVLEEITGAAPFDMVPKVRISSVPFFFRRRCAQAGRGSVRRRTQSFGPGPVAAAAGQPAAVG
ncbi:MAG: hypothetical protein R2864_09435 [Syntrophotaleaceae bacterium]